ncbi:MAG: hypothetical protein IJX16_07280 [Clostridia bacterium]|nr:hypothetical protein [Clostridia bacterium]
MEQKIQEQNGITLKEILNIIRKNIILLIVIVVLSTALGVVYARMQQPKYTATESVFFKAQNISNDNTSDNISVMIAYVDTVADFCDEGVVVDRANYHYDEYRKMKTKGEIASLKEYTDWSTTDDTYQGEVIEKGYYSASKISVKIEEKNNDNQRPFSFMVSYTDDNQELAQEKVVILVHALKMESKALNSNFEKKYFDGVEVQIIDAGQQGVSVNISRTKTIFLFFVLGVAIGLVGVYVIYLLDNTVKTKEELERITGTNILSVIEEQGGDK